MRLVVILVLLVASLYSLSLKELEEMPKSRERDFFIWRFIESKDTTKEDAIKASKLIFRANGKLRSAIYKKTGINLPKRRASKKPISKRDKELTLNLLKQDDIYNSWLKLSTKDKLTTFNLLGRDRKLLNKKLDSSIYSEMSKYYAINSFIYRVLNENLTNLKETIFNTRPVKGNKITYNNLMKLGFKLIKQNPKQASYFFYAARVKAKDRFSADRANFWVYLSTKDKKYLNYLAQSYDYNIYKLIALDMPNKPYPKPPQIKTTNNQKPPFDIKDPIMWARLKQKIFSKDSNLFALAKKYNYSEAIGYYSYILNKAYKDTKQYFPIIYKDVISKYPVDRQALILAIAKQESRFIPASVSSSFALGLMQFMPFLVKHIANERNEKVVLEDMFDPKVSIRFANTHLNYLEKWLYNPLFVAYAYNAGIGYTRRMIRKDIFKKGEYEPYLSLELVDNPQANEYAKKVLANYVIYKMLLKSPVKITDILNELHQPHLTDRFR